MNQMFLHDMQIYNCGLRCARDTNSFVYGGGVKKRGRLIEIIR